MAAGHAAGGDTIAVFAAQLVLPLTGATTGSDGDTGQLAQLASSGPEVNLYDIIYNAVGQLRDGRSGNNTTDAPSDAVVVVTAGNDNASRIRFLELVKFLESGPRPPVPVFIIAFSDGVCSSAPMRKMSRKEAGGECYRVVREVDIGSAFDKIMTSLCGSSP